MNTNKIAAAAAAAALIAGLTACSSGNTPTVEPGADTASPVATAPVEPTTASPSPTQANRAAKFGDTVTFEDGTKVKVTSGGFVPVEPDALDAVEGRAAIIVLAVTAGRTEVDASLMDLIKVTVGPAGKPVNEVYSSALGNESLSTILPGETQTVKIGYGIAAADAKNVRVEVDGPNYSDRPAIFKGAIG
jgi:hypothetical protein